MQVDPSDKELALLKNYYSGHFPKEEDYRRRNLQKIYDACATLILEQPDNKERVKDFELMQGWIEYITDLEYRALELSCAPNPDELLEKEYRITSKRKVTDKKVIRTASPFHSTDWEQKVHNTRESTRKAYYHD